MHCTNDEFITYGLENASIKRFIADYENDNSNILLDTDNGKLYCRVSLVVDSVTLGHLHLIGDCYDSSSSSFNEQHKLNAIDIANVISSVIKNLRDFQMETSMCRLKVLHHKLTAVMIGNLNTNEIMQLRSNDRLCLKEETTDGNGTPENQEILTLHDVDNFLGEIKNSFDNIRHIINKHLSPENTAIDSSSKSEISMEQPIPQRSLYPVTREPSPIVVMAESISFISNANN